jgi:hypothetical protein
MDKRFGAEGKLGIAGGGLVSEESQRKGAHDLSPNCESTQLLVCKFADRRRSMSEGEIHRYVPASPDRSQGPKQL